MPRVLDPGALVSVRSSSCPFVPSRRNEALLWPIFVSAGAERLRWSGASERTETMKLITRFELASRRTSEAAHPATRDLQRSRPQPSWHGGAPHGTRLARKPRRRVERARVLMFMTSAKSAKSSRFRNSTSGKRLDLAASSNRICCAGRAGLGLRAAVGVASCAGAWMRLEVAWAAEWPVSEKGPDLGH